MSLSVLKPTCGIIHVNKCDVCFLSLLRWTFSINEAQAVGWLLLAINGCPLTRHSRNMWGKPSGEGIKIFEMPVLLHCFILLKA